MPAPAEADQPAGVPVEVEPVGFDEYPFVAVGRAVQDRDPGAGRHWVPWMTVSSVRVRATIWLAES